MTSSTRITLEKENPAVNNNVNTEPLPRVRPGRRRNGATTVTLHRAPECRDSGKRRYRDRHQATDALNSARRQRAHDLAHEGATTRHEARAYKCDSCKGFHLTSLVEWVIRPVTPEPALAPVTPLAAIRVIAAASGFAVGTEEVAA